MDNYFNDKMLDSLDNSIEELSLDSLEDVSGGRIKAGGYALVLAAIRTYKSLGRDKQYAIDAIMRGWDEDCPFRTQFTDGTEEDRQAVIDYINRNWQ